MLTWKDYTAITQNFCNKFMWHMMMLLVSIFIWMTWIIWETFYLLLFIKQVTGKLGNISFSIAEVISLVCKIHLFAFKSSLSAGILMTLYFRPHVIGKRSRDKLYHCLRYTAAIGAVHSAGAWNYGLLILVSYFGELFYMRPHRKPVNILNNKTNYFIQQDCPKILQS